MAKKEYSAPPVVGTQPSEPLVYCGPTLPRAKILTMSVYKNGLPDHVTALVQEKPEIGKLIVPVSMMSGARKRTDTPGTEEHRLYHAILSSREAIVNGV
ncbi:hypothetical protein FACS1894216_02580 [Synergistales bacterium]|nr:hypothetical protein FACS1894216_02580 [Synergistales bacterium]